MKTPMQRLDIINLKKCGYSYRKIAEELHIDRKTVSNWCEQYEDAQQEIKTATDPLRIAELQNILIGYIPRKVQGNTKVCTPEVYAKVKRILNEEQEKDRLLRNHKQHLTAKQIHEILNDNGVKIGYTSVKTIVRDLKNQFPECFIIQDHPLGKRLEYDFGEVKLMIDGKRQKYYIAVFGAPASKFRWAYLYEKANMDVFVDSHVRFFHMIGGVWSEMVYDNMKNVVACFKKREKILTDEAKKLAAYYDFSINLTNVRSGNEKGFVESSVAYTRNQLFAKEYCFKSLTAAKKYMAEKLIELNKNSLIEKEKNLLKPANCPYQQCEERICHVDHCALVHIKNHAYSVPEDLVNQDITAKIYLDRIDFFRKNEHLCSHEKSTGPGKTVDIRHYIRTLKQKPGALCDSLALRSNPILKVVFDVYYNKSPKRFIGLVEKYKDLPDEKMAEAIASEAKASIKVAKGRTGKDLSDKAQTVVTMYNNLTVGGKH